MATTMKIDDRPNGPVAAAFLAGGIGSAALGLITTFYEINSKNAALTSALTWVKPVGPLSGKTSLSVIIFVLSWVVLYFIFRGKETNFTRIAAISFALVGIGLLGTFPPFWTMLAGG